MARPRKEIDKERLEALASRFLTVEEMAADLGVSKDLLERRFAALIKRGKDRAKASLRARQFETAMGRPAEYLREQQTEDGRQFGAVVRDKEGNPIPYVSEIKPNVTMQIFLGKQYLGQSDKIHFDGDGDGFEFVK